MQHDRQTLEMALQGFELKKQQIQTKMSELQRALGRQPMEPPVQPRPKRYLTPAARKRIAAAQKERWQKYREAHATA